MACEASGKELGDRLRVEEGLESAEAAEMVTMVQDIENKVDRGEAAGDGLVLHLQSWKRGLTRGRVRRNQRKCAGLRALWPP